MDILYFTPMNVTIVSLRYIVLSILISSVLSCGPVRLIAPYDEITDQRVTALHELVTRHLISLERELVEEGTVVYKDSKFYDQSRVDIEILKARALAIEKNAIVIKQIDQVDTMVDDLEELHKLGFVDVAQIEALKQPFTSAFAAMIKLQMALKRGE